MPIQLKRHLNRFSEFYPKGSKRIPRQLREAKPQAPDLSAFPLPLPSKKADYTCYAESRDGVVWYGAKTGLTRYDPGAPDKADRVQYFSALRDLPDNEVKALWLDTPSQECDYEVLWVLTAQGAAKLTMRWLTAEEKANLLLQESLDIVDRRGMMTQRHLSVPHRADTPLPYNESDNDGCFGCGFAIGELMHYAVLKRELGPDHPETLRIKKIATRASEAMLLLMTISGRGDGFVARTYLLPTEPVPNDGLYFRKLGDGTAQVVTTRRTLENEQAGVLIDASHPVPARLAKLYEDAGCDGTGLVYKGDTSSDELTLHYVHLYYLHEIMAEDDPELVQLGVEAGKATMAHIIDHGFEMHDYHGGPTTWAKWSERYFSFGSLGWVDACLNAAEILMYLRVVMAITGEEGRWKEAADYLVSKDYPAFTPQHESRFTQLTMAARLDATEDIMYGDHMLATAAFWPLILLEPDEGLREVLRKGYVTWRGSIGREFNPGYDLPFHLACPGEPLDWARLERWFYRFGPSRLASPVSLTPRHDMPVRVRRGGEKETGFLLPPDESVITKYDRNPNAYTEGDPSDRTVESCYVYTFAYWFGRYYGMIAPEES